MLRRGVLSAVLAGSVAASAPAQAAGLPVGHTVRQIVVPSLVQAGATRIAVARNAVKRLHAARAHVVGGLLTHFVPEHAGQGYQYGGYNYYSYGDHRPKLLTK